MIDFILTSCSKKSSIFSDISNIITIINISVIVKKKVPKNFLIIYQSIFSYYKRESNFLIILFFQALKLPILNCSCACSINHM